MLKGKKYIITFLALVALVIIGSYGVGSAAANDNFNYPSLVQKLVERFDLEEAEVEEVFDEAKAEHFAQKQAMFEDRLNSLVSEGVLTAEQRYAILAKMAEMHEEKEALRSLPPKERREFFVDHRGELQEWAEENGIDLSMLGKGEEYRHGFMGRHHFDSE